MAPSAEDPVRLVEDPATGDRFLVYGTDKGPRLDIRYEGETLWMTQAQIAALFGVNVPAVSKHIANVIGQGELDEESSVSKMERVRREGSRNVSRDISLYSLDMVISVGYRVSSAQATLFRRWATGVLVQFAKSGFVIDARRLKQPENADRVAELREIIRDIRSDEANVYRELQRICAMCQDYDAASAAAREFYQRTQAKLVYAVTSSTPSELVAGRADHTAPNMGLTGWDADEVRKADARVSKNYLAAPELRELNRLTTILLDIFEDQLELGRLVVMDDARRLLDDQLSNLGRSVLRGGGSVKSEDARRIAESEYEKFDAIRKVARQKEADAVISELAREARKLPKPPRR